MKLESCDQIELDNYRVQHKIGEGGFGQVYLATQLNTDQSVAIKFLTLSSDLDEDKRNRYIQRFERETQLSSRLQHPNIVRLLDKGRAEGLLYAVFEYVEGQTLKQRLAEHGPMSAVDAADIMGQVLDALSHAHAQGVIHRDIKPANIMLSQSGARTYAKVLDFGIGTLINEARQLDYQSLTLTQETLGTPSYSAPEQLRGEPPTVKTDLYVWGLVFIECLTAAPALSGNNLGAIFHKQFSASNVPLPQALAGHPLGDLLRRVLNKKVDQRATSAADIYHALKQLHLANLVGEVAAAEPITTLGAIEATQIGTQWTHTAERKQISVLSINLSVHGLEDGVVDDEVIEAIGREQQSQCIDLAVRYAAFHVGTLGDTLLFYFGYPFSSDNDARLCARTSLELVDELKKRNALMARTQRVALELRGGFHCGKMTCYPDLVPAGQSVSTAMELARQAGPGQVLCSEAVRSVLESYLEFESDVSQTDSLKAFPLREEKRFEAFGFLRGTQKHLSFVGREQELAQLIDAVKQDKARFVFVQGEAGIGKSRLIYEMRNQATVLEHKVAQCLPEQANNALYPILNMLRHLYRLSGTSALEQRIAGVSSAHFDSEEQKSLAAMVLFQWMGLTLPESIPKQYLAPNVQKALLFKLLTALILTTGDKRQLLIVEDVHWADPTTQEFVQWVSESEIFNRSQAILLVSSRHACPASWQPKITKVTRLNVQESQAFVQALSQQQNIAPEVMSLLLERADGVPLFIEEIWLYLEQHQGLSRLNGQLIFASAKAKESIPLTLRESLQQKLDSLGPAKETAQLAAVIGREFDYALLVASSPLSEALVQTNIQAMLRSGLVYQHRKVKGGAYIFKHALVRDVAYDTMPLDMRRQMHANLVQELEGAFRARSERFPAEYALHLSQSGALMRASHAYLKAARQAEQRFANLEALEYLKLGQDLVLPLEVCEQRNTALVVLFEKSGDTYNLLGDVERARESFESALAHAPAAHQEARLHRKIAKCWETHHHNDKVLSHFEQAKAALQGTDSREEDWWHEYIEQLIAPASFYYWSGDVEALDALVTASASEVESRGSALQQARFWDVRLQHALRANHYCVCPDTLAMSLTAWEKARLSGDEKARAWSHLMYGMSLMHHALWQDTQPGSGASRKSLEHAANEFESLLHISQRVGDEIMQSRCLTYLCVVYRRMGEVDATHIMSQRAMEKARLLEMKDYVGAALANQGWVMSRRGESENARVKYLGAIEIWDALSAQYPYPFQWLARVPLLCEATEPELWLQQQEKLQDESQQWLPQEVSAFIGAPDLAIALDTHPNILTVIKTFNLS